MRALIPFRCDAAIESPCPGNRPLYARSRAERPFSHRTTRRNQEYEAQSRQRRRGAGRGRPRGRLQQFEDPTAARKAARRPTCRWPPSLGKGEGALNIIAWAGYAESGQNDPKVDWVHPFEQQTGCQVNVKIGNTSDEMVQLMKTGQYDGVSASGDATLRLIYGGDVAPVNTDLVPNYKTDLGFLKNGNWNSVNGQMYGIPHGWGANLLMWDPSKVTTAPDSWSAVFDKSSALQGQSHRLRLADLHRRRGAVPDGDPARSSASRTRTRSRRSSSTPRSTCSRSRRRTSASTGPTTPRRCRRSSPAPRWSARPGRSSPTRSTAAARRRSRPSCRRKASTGWSDTWMISSKAEASRTACTSGWTTSSRHR